MRYWETRQLAKEQIHKRIGELLAEKLEVLNGIAKAEYNLGEVSHLDFEIPGKTKTKKLLKKKYELNKRINEIEIEIEMLQNEIFSIYNKED